MIKYRYNDGGRQAAGFKGSAGDCVTRAIAIAAELPYAEVYKALAEGNGTQRASSRTKKKSKTARDGINVTRKWFKDYMASIGFKWVPTMQIGSGCKVHLNAKELPPGRLIVSIAKHYTCVIDGVLNDTFNCSISGGTLYPLDWTGEIPKGAVKQDNGYLYKPERCVYGYWIKR